MKDDQNHKRVYNSYQNMTLTEAVNVMISKSGLPEKALSADIGKPLSTLQRELNPNDEGAKVGIETLYPLIRACCGESPEEAPEPLVWLCRRLGFEPMPFGYAEPNSPSIEKECMESMQAISKAHGAILAEADPKEVDALILQAKLDLDQDATLYRREYSRKH